jgi:restriction system protein
MFGTPSVIVSPPPDLPSITMAIVLEFGGEVADGRLIECVAPPWYEILALFERDKEAIYRLEPRQWEEMIAGAYSAEGFDEVILTPRSGDGGRDVIATRNGLGSIRIFDQVKAYGPGRVVPADDVRALAGVLAGYNNVSKGVVTTTSTFAPLIEQDGGLKSLIPYRIELRPRDVLLPWLQELRAKRSDDGA